MSILDAVNKAKAQSRASAQPYGHFYEWLDGLDAADKEALDSALREGTVSVKALHDALREEGAPIGTAPLYDYRKQLLRKFTG